MPKLIDCPYCHKKQVRVRTNAECCGDARCRKRKQRLKEKALNAPIKRIFSKTFVFMTYDVGGMLFCEDELTLIRAVDEPAKTYKGQFEVGNAPSFNKILDSLPF